MTSSYMSPVRKPACTSPMSSGQRLQVCRQTKKRLIQESFYMQLMPQKKATAVVVTAEDTDVMLLCLALSPDISCPLFQKCGTKNRVRYIDINKFRHGLGDGVFNYLIGMHAYTGCDTVSAFAGRGKPGALKLMRS